MHAGSRCARACGACAGPRPGSPKMGVCAACLTGRFSSGTRSSCGVDHASLSSRSELTESPHPSSSEVPATTALHGLSQQQPGIDGGFMLLTIWAASLTVSLSSLPFRTASHASCELRRLGREAASCTAQKAETERVSLCGRSSPARGSAASSVWPSSIQEGLATIHRASLALGRSSGAVRAGWLASGDDASRIVSI